MGSKRIGILTDRAFLDIEAGETEHLLLKHTVILVVDLAHEELLGETRVSGIAAAVLDFVHSLHKIFLCDAERPAEIEGIETALGFVHDHHNVVGWLVEDKQFAVAVAYDTARRKLNALEKSIGIGTLAIVVADQLEHEKAHDVDRDDQGRHASDDITPVVKIEIFHAVSSSLNRLSQKATARSAQNCRRRLATTAAN